MDDGLHDFAVRIEDGVGRALAGVDVTISDATGTPVTSATTSSRGLVRLRLPSGVFCIAFQADGQERRASFLLDQDQIGGFSVRVPSALGNPKSPAHSLGAGVSDAAAG